jgi:hypothetical protein
VSFLLIFSKANGEKITELEQALARAEARQEPTEASSEIALLRTQVELYFNDLREEKKKRAQEEVTPTPTPIPDLFLITSKFRSKLWTISHKSTP